MVPIEIANVVEEIEGLLEDDSIPKSIKLKLSKVLEELKSAEDVSIVINRVVHDFEEISEDVNTQPYVRTKIWAVVSILEGL